MGQTSADLGSQTTSQTSESPVATTTNAPAPSAAFNALIQRKVQRRALQRRALQRQAGGAAKGEDDVQAEAAKGIAGAGGSLPHLDAIQKSFGQHDVSGVVAHTDSAAASASETIGAQAYATGNHVAFTGAPDLHTAAHEAAHVVQQRSGVHLKGGVGEQGDSYEQHADAVADAVVHGESAEAMLGPVGGSASGGATQMLAVQKTTKMNPMPPEPEQPQAKEGESQKPETSELKDSKTKEELKALEQACTDALSIATKAVGNCALDNATYVTWMDNGAKSDTKEEATKTRVATVKSNFEKIKKGLEEDKIIFKKWDLPADNKIKYANTYAYVRSGEKDNNMYLGGVFWVAKAIGIDSKAGTIVHELSHRLCGTKDWTYGTAASKANAKSDPAKATTNADNHEHMAESS